MFNSLFSKMAGLLFILVLILAAAFTAFTSYTTDMYQQEVTQKLNYSVAQHFVEEQPLFSNKQLNKEALDHLFHMLMVVNPNLEIYLVDLEGKILTFFALEGEVIKQKVALAPIKQFINGTHTLPIFGDDPKSENREKVFSAAAIKDGNQVSAYLYVILGSKIHDGIASKIQDSYIMQLSTFSIIGGIIIAMLFALVAFFLVTRRLRSLTKVIHSFRQSEPGIPTRYQARGSDKDEINQLGRQFNLMADRIDAQIRAIENNDNQRREMVANISHDLRTPLTSLHGYLETLLIKKDKISVDERQHYLKIAHSQSEQLTHLVSSLFELAKLESCDTLVNIEAFSLAELTSDVMNKFRLTAQTKRISLNMNFADNLPFAYGDIALIQRVLDNLIENALRHTPENGFINVSLTADTKQIQVRVADSGTGIPDDDLPYIFDRFYRQDKTRNTNGGHAGLGLSIVKRIIDLHNSSICSESSKQKGTVFSFNLDISLPA